MNKGLIKVITNKFDILDIFEKACNMDNIIADEYMLDCSDICPYKLYVNGFCECCIERFGKHVV